MTWLDNIKQARKVLYAEWNDAKASKYYDDQDAALFRALTLTPKQKLIREMVLQLKTGAIDRQYFRRKFGVDVWQEFQSVYEPLADDRLIECRNGTIELTRSGLLQVDHFLSQFFEPELQAVRYV